MPTVNVLNQSGEQVSKITLNDDIFGIEPNQQVLYDVVNAQLAALRQGTAKTKGRSEVRGGGRKPWRQKGTGRARHGSIRSPLWRGGGIVFGPTPRKYTVKVNQKVKRLALKSALSYHVKEEKALVLNQFNLETAKTKVFVEVLNNLKVEGTTLVLVRNLNQNLIYASSNVPYALVKEVSQASVYEILKHKNLILTEDAIKYYEEVLG